MQIHETRGGIRVQRCAEPVDAPTEFARLAEALNSRRGALLSSGFEAPGRYRRHALGFVDPPLCLTGRGRAFELVALNARGELLLPVLASTLRKCPAVAALEQGPDRVAGSVHTATEPASEEERSRLPSLFSVLRAVTELFAAPDDPHLGLYGAFGYDLAFQFDPIRSRLARGSDQRDLVLYLPDEITVQDPERGLAHRFTYGFEIDGTCSLELAGGGATAGFTPGNLAAAAESDHGPGAYESSVDRAKAAFAGGDLFEVVLSQTFSRPCPHPPAELYHRLCEANPSPYAALLNLGEGEFLVAASPEMFVRVAGRRVETCPISGTIARGGDALADADNILALLNSPKECAELTMCTDVDRNDKARVCEPGSVRLLARRQIELYSRLIHTVDHVEGILRDGCDALDAFLSHAWAVTVTGAPKRAALQFVEDHEGSARRWYGGAFGRLGFDGSIDTGLTLRTLRLAHGRAEVRAGATLLHHSDPAAEAAECRLKASALLAVLDDAAVDGPTTRPQTKRGLRLLLVDHEDSFVHSLANLFREAGADITTRRAPAARAALDDGWDLVLLSPGPGRPDQFAMRETIAGCLARGLPLFGICLGLQGIAEYFGGHLRRLDRPVHGEASTLYGLGGLFADLPERFRAGRYHSLVADRESLPACLTVTAEAGDGTIMAIEHESLPIAAVQFHPESLMTLGTGRRIAEAVLDCYAGRRYADADWRTRGTATALSRAAASLRASSLSL